MSKTKELLPKKVSKPAVFSSEFRNQMITMRPGTIDRSQGGTGDKGKRISFEPNGRYETSDIDEIKFLKEKENNPIPFCRIKCIQEPKFEK